jgi:serine protease Do
LTLAALAVGAITPAAHAQGTIPDYPRIVEDVGASVVHIVVSRSGSRAPGSEARQEEKGREPYGTFDSRRPARGSGFILSPDGYIATAASVVDAGDEISVNLADGRSLRAKRVGADKRTDIALLKVDATSLKPVRFGDVLKLKTGQHLLLVGSAFEGMNTVADGIVSHHSRSSNPGVSPMGAIAPYIATTVPLQPGNGGAPLFDGRGEVVGMVTSMYVSRNPVYAPISFAVPGDVIRNVTDSLRARGYVSRGTIRVIVQEVTKDLADAAGIARRGALVNKADPGGPADRAGIHSGDIILQFNKEPVNKLDDLFALILSSRPGTRVPVQVWQKGARVDLVVEIEELERRP